jgi:hypothetical protein
MRTCVFDLEGNDLYPACTRIWCGVFIDVNTEEVYEFRPNEMDKMVSFMSTCKTLVAHNGLSYDFPVLDSVLGYKFRGNKIDSLIMSRLLYYNISRPAGVRAGPHSVEAWGTRLGRHKPDHNEWSMFSEAMLHRCKEDAFIQLEIYRKCLARMKKYDWPKSVFEMSFKLFDIFHKQEHYAWGIDVPLLGKYIKQLTKWIERIDTVLQNHLPFICIPLETKQGGEYGYVKKPFLKSGKYAAITLKHYPDADTTQHVGGPFSRLEYRRVNIASDKEVKDMLLNDGWIPKEYNYKKDPTTGRPATDDKGNPIRSSPKLSADDPFVGVNGKVGRLIAKRTKCQHRLSVLQGFEQSIRTDGRMSQRITGIAATGRLTHGGIVNIPSADAFFGKQMRKIFSSKSGYVIVGTDAKSCQDRMLAARANDPSFTKMLLDGNKDDGTDSHSLAMHAINEVLAKHKLELINRKIAKNFNYGWKFGASDNKLGKMAKAGKEVGADIRVALSGVFKAQAALIDKLTEEWKSNATVYMNDWGKLDYKNGYIRGLDGRPIFIPSEHQILVYMLQSDEAIMMQAALCKLYSDCTKKGWVHGREYGFVANVHDEFSAEVRQDLAKEFAQMAEDAIAWSSNYFKLSCSQEGEAAIGKNWYEVH